MKALIRAAVLSMGLWTTTSCLVTDDLQPQEVPPTPENRWPRIVEESVTPRNWEPLVPVGDVACQKIALTIGKVADDDTADKLYARWFVDYDTGDGPNKVFRGQAEIPPPADDASEKVERVGPSYSFQPEFFCKGYHVVKVIVADGRFDPDSEDFDVVEGADRGSASYSWAVDTSGCANATEQCQ